MNLFKNFRLITSSRLGSTGSKDLALSTGHRISPRVFPSTGFTSIPASVKLEEETWEWYKPESFYPVRIGEVLHSRYQILYKMGYGATSTVWMCRDLERDAYVCLKSMVCDYPSVDREIKAYESLSKAVATIPSFETHRIRLALDHFKLRLDSRDYHLLVHRPLGIDLDELLQMYFGRLPMLAVLGFAKDFLLTLQSIHNAKIVHTDIQSKNILFTMNDETIFQETEEDEITNPSARKITGNSIVFATKVYPGLSDRWFGTKSRHVLCDFGEARTWQDNYVDMVQPPPSRAPEVFLHAPWGTPVDIWSFGCLMWHLATGEQLFPRTREEDQDRADRIQLASMAMLLGSPPPALLASSNSSGASLKFFNKDGSAKWDVPHETLESRLAAGLEGSRYPPTADEVQGFLGFIRRVLIWEDHKRPSASELLKDPWVNQRWDGARI